MARSCSLVFFFAASLAQAATIDVSITGFAFSPQSVTVTVGDTVRWTNNDVVAHTATSDTSVWNSGTLNQGQTYSFTFNNAGTFPYHCAFHPDMLASVNVRPVVGTTQQVTSTNTVAEVWGVRKRTISLGNLMYWNGTQLRYFDGTSDLLVQTTNALNDPTFTVGTDSVPGHVIGLWRTDADFHGYVNRDGGAPVLITYTNPIDAAKGMNVEAVAIDEGTALAGLNTTDANANNIALVYKVNAVTGATTLIGGTPVFPANPGRNSQIFTSQGKAVWLDSDGTNTRLKYYDGRPTPSDGDYTTTIETDSTLDQPVIARGKIVYTKLVNGIRQVFAYDTTAGSPAPVQLTNYSVTRAIEGLNTDGRRVAWAWSLANTRRHIVVNGGVVLTDSSNKPADGAILEFFPFSLDRGQLAWRDVGGALRFMDSAGTINTVPLGGSSNIQKAYLADGYIEWLGVPTGQANVDVFRYTGSAPAATNPPLAITASPGPGRITVGWEKILGASSYNLYMAKTTGVTKDNYASLSGGRKFTAVTPPYTIEGLPDGTYYFVATAIENSVEGSSSGEVSATVGASAWSRVFDTQHYSFYDVKADRANLAILYAASSDGVWKSTDSGRTWTAAPGLVNGLDIRAVGANGNTVIAMSKVGDIYRSANGGTSWTLAFDGVDIGEQNKSILEDPLTPATWYAGDTKLSGSVSTYVVRSIDDGANWSQLPDSAAGEIRAYAMAGDPVTSGTIYASGTGLPVAKSPDSGTTWTNVQPAGGFFYALAAPAANTVYTAGVNFSQDSLGVYKTTNGGGVWNQMVNGMPNPLPRLTALFAETTNNVFAGGDGGFYFTTNGGTNWSAGPVLSIRALAMTTARTLVAATDSGLYLLPLNPAPSITLVSPASGIAAGGTSVTISGTNFSATSGLRVLFGGVDGTVNLGSSTATSIAVTTPAHASGTVDVTVINPDGQSTVSASSFTYLACTYEITPLSASYSSSATTGNVQVSTNAGCGWTAVAPSGFVTITGGASGTGNGTVSYSVSANATGAGRSATLTIAGKSFVVNQAAAGITPPIVTAASASSTQVSLSWSSVAGATSYNILRSSGGGGFITVTSTGAQNLTDSGLTTGTGYLYRIDAMASTTLLASSNVDFAVPFAYTDSSISAGVPIRAAHFSELRLVVDAVRTAAGWPAATYTNTISVGGTAKAVDLTELRTAIDRVRAAFGIAPMSYTDPSVMAGSTTIKAAHIQEMRTASQ